MGRSSVQQRFVGMAESTRSMRRMRGFLLLRNKVHAADRALARAIANDFRMHRAGERRSSARWGMLRWLLGGRVLRVVRAAGGCGSRFRGPRVVTAVAAMVMRRGRVALTCSSFFRIRREWVEPRPQWRCHIFGRGRIGGGVRGMIARRLQHGPAARDTRQAREQYRYRQGMHALHLDPVALQLYRICEARHAARRVIVPTGILVIAFEVLAHLHDRGHPTHRDVIFGTA